jgi:hypothetical protein
MDSDGMIYLPSIMKLGPVIQAILRFCLTGLKVCNVGIAEGRDL